MENNMNLGNWLAENILSEETKIKTVVAIYPGRFQPMGKHHAKTFKWLQSKFKNAYVGTSGKVSLPKSPFSFAEKKKIINSHGISNVVQVKNPYKAEEILRKFDPETTAAVFMVGKKDASRLGGKFFRPWKGKAEVGYKDGAYTIIAPHVSLSVSGYGEMSGTTIRTALGDRSLEKSDKIKLFKGIFGHTKNYNLIVNKLEKLNETIDTFCSNINIGKILSESSNFANSVGAEVDDGPGGYWGNQKSWKMFGDELEKNINRGMKVLNYISGDDEFFFHNTGYPDGPTGTVSYWPNGVKGEIGGTKQFGDLEGTQAFNQWKKHIERTAAIIGWKFIEWEKKEIKRLDVIYEGLITEGGAYGHMSHPFDDKGLTFGDFKNIINISLQGKLDINQVATEKTDGQNLFITWNGKLLAARNAGDIKRGGVDSKAIAKKFAGRGNIEKAFNYAMKDLSKAIGSINDKQKKKIFNDGNNWVNMEIMYPASANVINYDAPYLQFHNVLQYKEGKAIGAVNDGARMLAGMIKQVNANVQKSFSVIGPQILKMKAHQDFSEKQPYFISKLNKLMSKYKMKDSNTFGDYHQAWWEDFVEKKIGKLENRIKMGLVQRWAFFDKSFRLNRKNIDDEKVLAKSIEFDKMKHADQVKKNMLPFEVLFFELGVEVLKNVDGFLAANPDKAVQNIRKQVQSSIAIVKKGGDIKKLNRLSQQLNKLNSIGGMNAIVPSEGLVFVYKGNTYKLTGAFAPINQITGMIYF
tara:strand:- start:122 stop:2371 length:2250 start_codon:yes stop_codon:yes gene_type:complete